MKGLCNHNHRAPATVPRAEEEELLLPFFISPNNHPLTCQKGFPFQERTLQDHNPTPPYFLIVLNKLVKVLSLAGA